MKLIIGLGNPGAKHADNRHNIGFMAVDAIFRHHGLSSWRVKFSAELAEGKVGNEKTILFKPQTFMNLSGQAVGEAMRFYKLNPEDLIVFYDELDLAPGKIRIKRGGGHGGHNGIKSLDAHCGKDYKRVRLGIGHPGHKDKVNAHVLGDFAKADQVWLEPLLDRIGEHIGLLVAGNDSSFMNKISLTTVTEKAKPKPKKAQSHIHQAHTNRPKPEPAGPKVGPMAEMLKKLLGNKE